MELLTRNTRERWTRWPDPVIALEALAGADPGVDLVVVRASHPGEAPADAAMIRLARRLSRTPLRVVAACDHPTRAWLTAVITAGADQAVLWEGPARTGPEGGSPLGRAVEIREGICPALVAWSDPEGVLSVCGERHCRWVLAPHHLARWCLAHPDACPVHREESHA